MYDLPVCSCCTHAPHEDECEFCEVAKKPHVYKLVPLFKLGHAYNSNRASRDPCCAICNKEDYDH